VSYNPGGGFDAYARGMSKVMLKYLPEGVNVVVKNMPGAGGRTARTFVMRAKPDGHTIGIIHGGSSFLDHFFFKADIDYDPTKFIYLGQVATERNIALVGKDSPYKSVEDLKNATQPVRIGIVGVGSAEFPRGVILGEVLGFPYTFVSGYSGSTAALTGVARGDSDFANFNPSSARSFVESGDLIPLFVFGDPDRDPLFPDVPTSSEIGLPDDLGDLSGVMRFIFAPPGMPQPVTNYMGDLVSKVLADSDFVAWAKAAKRPIDPAGPDAATAAVKGWETTYGRYADAIMAEVKKLGGS
jgi:tripartite-type tricarboxylate transporter receptor subunit TctC